MMEMLQKTISACYNEIGKQALSHQLFFRSDSALSKPQDTALAKQQQPRPSSSPNSSVSSLTSTKSPKKTDPFGVPLNPYAHCPLDARPKTPNKAPRKSAPGAPPRSEECSADMLPGALLAEWGSNFSWQELLDEANLQKLFNVVAVDGYIHRQDMVSIYEHFEMFGLHDADTVLDELAAKYNLSSDGRLAYPEFSLLMAHLVGR